MNAERLQSVAVAALICGVGGLLLSVYMALQLQSARARLEPLQPLMEEVMGEDGTLRTRIRVPAGTPINLDVPVDERVTVQVDTLIPINARVVVPIRSPVGNYEIPIPIRANIPVRANLPVRFRHTFELRTTTPEDLYIPIEVGQ